MSKKKLILLTLTLFSLSFLSATVWRVDNNTGVDADFTNLQDAHNSASNGDILIVTGSTTNYDNISLTKSLTIIGTGYFLTLNPDTQANQHSSEAGYFIFNAGSEGSVVTGMSITYIDINVDNITIKRNKIYSTNSSYDAINLNNVSNIYIYQNYIYANGTSSNAIELNNNSQDVLISNNLIKHSYYSSYSIMVYSTCSATITNNFLYGNVSLYNSEFYNNIMKSGDFYDHNNTNNYYNNIGHSDQFAPCGENGNQCSVNMTTVFIGTGSTDGQYQLAEGSPAIGAGVSGEDCGAFDGLYPYVLSGMPSEIPAIYYFFSPGAGFEIPVEIKAKSHE